MTKKELRKIKRMSKLSPWEWLTTNIYNETLSQKALFGNVVLAIVIVLIAMSYIASN